MNDLLYLAIIFLGFPCGFIVLFLVINYFIKKRNVVNKGIFEIKK